MAEREFVKDLNIVQQLNDEFGKSEDLLKKMEGKSADLAASLTKVAEAHDNSRKYSQENLDIAKAEAKIAKSILDVEKAKENKNRLAIAAAKTKLFFAKLFYGKNNQITKELIKQYELKKKQEDKERDIANEMANGAQAVENVGSSMLANIGIAGGLFGLFSSIFATTAAIGKNFGAIGMNSEKFREQMWATREGAAALGQNLEDAVPVMTTLTEGFGFSRNEAAELAVSIMDTSMAIGLSNDEGAKLFGTLTKVAGLSADTAQDFMKQTALLAEASGAAPTAVMKDIARSSETIAKFTAKSPEHLMKAAIQANRLGMTLDDVGRTAEGLLNFQDSLNAEVEASIMLGRDVNLQRARELALAGDTEGLAVEIANQVGSQAEFEKMNVLQKQALARALNMEVSQLSKVVQNQDKARTLGEAIAEQEGLESMIGQESMDNFAKILADLQVIGVQLMEDIAPHAEGLAAGIGNFVKGLSKSKSLLPGLKVLIGFLAAKSLITAVAGIYTSFAQIPLGIGIPLGVAAVATMMNTISSMPSYQGLESGRTAMIQSGAAIAHAGENITRTEDMRAFNKPTEEKLDKLIRIMDGAFGFGGNAARDTANRLGDKLAEMG